MHRLKNIKPGDLVRVCVPVVARVLDIDTKVKPAAVSLQNDGEGEFFIRLIDYLTIEKIEQVGNEK